MDFQYSCLSKTGRLDLLWSSPSSRFYLASMEINLNSNSLSSYIWHIDTRNVEQFLSFGQADADEINHLYKVIDFLPTNALYSQ
jgi:hypothetical protein